MQQCGVVVVGTDARRADVPQIRCSKRFYTELRMRFELSAQPAIRVISKVADAYATLRSNIAAGNYGPPSSARRTKVLGSDRFPRQSCPAVRRTVPVLADTRHDRRTEATVSIWTVHGRLRDLGILAAPRIWRCCGPVPLGKPT